MRNFCKDPLHLVDCSAQDIVNTLKDDRIRSISLSFESLGRYIDYSKMCSIIEKLKKTQISSINLSYTCLSLCNDRELDKIFKALKKTQITSINLSNNDLNSVQLLQIIHAVKKTQITSINLSNNDLNSVQLLQIIHAVKKTQITSIHLSFNTIRSEYKKLEDLKDKRGRNLLVKNIDIMKVTWVVENFENIFPINIKIFIDNKNIISYLNELLVQLIEKNILKSGERSLAFELIKNVPFNIDKNLKDLMIDTFKTQSKLSESEKLTLALLYEYPFSSLIHEQEPNLNDINEAAQLYREIIDSSPDDALIVDSKNGMSVQKVASYLFEQLNILYPSQESENKQSILTIEIDLRYRPLAYSFWGTASSQITSLGRATYSEKSFIRLTRQLQ